MVGFIQTFLPLAPDHAAQRNTHSSMAAEAASKPFGRARAELLFSENLPVVPTAVLLLYCCTHVRHVCPGLRSSAAAEHRRLVYAGQQQYEPTSLWRQHRVAQRRGLRFPPFELAFLPCV